MVEITTKLSSVKPCSKMDINWSGQFTKITEAGSSCWTHGGRCTLARCCHFGNPLLLEAIKGYSRLLTKLIRYLWVR
jgi:hypothetical protein